MARSRLRVRSAEGDAPYSKWFTLGGAAIGAAAGLIAWIWPQEGVLIPLILSLVTTLVGQCLDLRLSGHALQTRMNEIAPMAALDREILEQCRLDPFLAGKYRTLEKQIRELAEGGYTIHGLEEVYSDDVRQIKKLGKGESLRSSCPIANTSVQGVVDQITDPNYIRSMREHIEASKRGVFVRRLYFFRSTDMFPPAMLKHLKEIPEENHEVRIVFRDKLPTNTDIDFLVFGDHTVSMGVLDVDTGICKSTRITKNRSEVRDAIARFDAVWDFASPLKEVEKELMPRLVDRSGKPPKA